MATNAVPASGRVAGKVGTWPGPGEGSNSPVGSRWPASAWPIPVRTTAPAAISAVSIHPALLARNRVPGQSAHQKATMTTSGSE